MLVFFSSIWQLFVDIPEYFHKGGVRWPYLCISQHDVLDERQTPRLAVLHAHIVHLVATDLSVLLAGSQ